MKALFVSNDPAMFDELSAVRARMRAYAAAIGELHIVSAARVGVEEAHEGALHLYPLVVPKTLRVNALTAKAHTLIKAHGIEVVSGQDPFEHGLAALRACAGTGAKLHLQVHTDFLSPYFIRESLKNRLRVRIAGRTLPRACAIRVVSERIKERMMKRYGARVVEPQVMPVSVSLTPVEPAALPAHDFPFALIAVGRLEPEKRVQDVMRAVRRAREKHRGIGLFVVGDGRERARLERIAERLGLGAQVRFLGQRFDAAGLMASAQAFIQASCYEGFQRTLCEAAVAGTPIITSDSGIAGSVLKDGESALIAPVGDPDALARRILQLVDEPALRATLAVHAREAVHDALTRYGATPERIATDLARALAPAS